MLEQKIPACLVPFSWKMKESFPKWGVACWIPQLGQASLLAFPESSVIGSQADVSCNIPFLPKPVWNALKRHQIIWSATNFSSTCALWSLCWVVDGGVSATPLIQRGFPIFPYTSSEFQFSDYSRRQQKTLNHLTKCEGFALNLKMGMALYTQIYAYLHGICSL